MVKKCLIDSKKGKNKTISNDLIEILNIQLNWYTEDLYWLIFKKKNK